MLSNGEKYWETKFSELVLETIEKLIARLTKIMCINHSANTEDFENLLALGQYQKINTQGWDE